MTYDETFEIVYILQSNYPNFYTKQTDAQAAIMTKLWSEAFADYDYNLVSSALKVVILKKKDFPPNIAEINEEIVKMTNPTEQLIDGEMAWGEAQRLMRKYGSYLFDEQKAELDAEIGQDEALEKTIRACGGLEGIRMCDMDNLGTLRAQFIKIYNSYARRKRDSLLLPNSLKTEINAIKQENINRLADMTKLLSDGMGVAQ